MLGGRITGHFQQYPVVNESDVPAWWRVPGLEAYGGVAMLTQ